MGVGAVLAGCMHYANNQRRAERALRHKLIVDTSWWALGTGGAYLALQKWEAYCAKKDDGSDLLLGDESESNFLAFITLGDQS